MSTKTLKTVGTLKALGCLKISFCLSSLYTRSPVICENQPNHDFKALWKWHRILLIWIVIKSKERWYFVSCEIRIVQNLWMLNAISDYAALNAM